MRYRVVKKVERKKESFSDKGLKVEERAGSAPLRKNWNTF